ncbi:antibiotic biosynthesis monooxygenase [Neisseriaceae bacterium JH1-16]|nr:antibiotic biosynthesis monooxygenase [Neisseriaceae bacterium JH1-16]
MTIYVLAMIKCKLEGIEAVKAAMRDMVPASRQEPGCLQYDLFESAQAPGTLQVFEAYVSDSALEAHRGSAHYQAYRAKVADCLAEPVRVELLSAVNVAPLERREQASPRVIT